MENDPEKETVAKSVVGAALVGAGYLLHELLDEMETLYCPVCGEEADFFVKKKRHYCWKCENYLDKLEEKPSDQ